MRVLHVTCLAAIGSLGCSELAVGGDTAPIVGGTVNPLDHGVVALVAGDEQFCTGSVIAPNIVLTAAHCLPPNAPFSLDEIEIFFGPDVAQGGERIGVAAAQAHPLWSANTLANDIGLVALSSPAPVPPLGILADVASADATSLEARIIGYGTTTKGGNENGVKRSGSMTIDDIDDSTLYLSQGPALTCSGDSGGPLLVSTELGELIAGIHSRSDCETLSLAERVDRHLAGFVGEFMLEHAAEASCEPDGQCAAGCATPDTDCVPPVDAVCDGPGQDCPANLAGPCNASGSRGSASLTFLVLIALFRRQRRRRC